MAVLAANDPVAQITCAICQGIAQTGKIPHRNAAFQNPTVLRKGKTVNDRLFRHKPRMI